MVTICHESLTACHSTQTCSTHFLNGRCSTPLYFTLKICGFMFFAGEGDASFNMKNVLRNQDSKKFSILLTASGEILH